MPNPLIAVSVEVKEKLDKLKVHEREPYGSVVKRLLEEYEKTLNSK